MAFTVNKLNVICVDDEHLLMNHLLSLCLRLECVQQVHGFTASAEALTFAESHPIDVALLDINMPQINGLELGRRLQEIYPKINLIYTTAHAQYALDALRSDCSGYLLKPISIDDLRHQLDVLRFPPTEQERLEIRCFGNFEVFYHREPVHFSYAKTKELLAYLVDRNGAACSNGELAAVLWDDDENHLAYLKRMKQDLTEWLTAHADPSILSVSRGAIAIRCDMVDCDLFDYRAGQTELFRGEYMEQYSWAETTKGSMMFRGI